MARPVASLLSCQRVIRSVPLPLHREKVVAEKRSRTTAEDVRPGKKAAAGGEVKTTKSPKAEVPVKSAAPIVDLATSGSESEDGEENC